MIINPVLGKTTQQRHVFLFRMAKFSLVTGMILIDLQKAFDTVNHDILLEKLSIIGFSDYTVKWFQSDLSSRKFMVNF